MSVISPVVPPVLPQRDHGAISASDPSPQARRPLPLPTLTPRRSSSVVYGSAALDCHGRIAERAMMQALGWSAGLHLRVIETCGVLTVHPDSGGTVHISAQGHLRIPAALRHRGGLVTGDRVLLAADLDRSRLTVYPPAVLDTLLSSIDDPTGGEPA